MNKLSNFTFRPSKNYVFTTETNEIPNIFRKYKLPELTKVQKNFNRFRPVKPFDRFGKAKMADTGINPPEIFLKFIKKDGIRGSYTREIPESIKEGINYRPTNPLKWTIGTTYFCNKEKLVPKIDPYKEYNFIKRNKEDVENFQKSYLPSDHISIRNPRISRSIDLDSYPYLKMKSQYGPHKESESFWSPRIYDETSAANRSSVDYNIISNEENPISGVKSVLLFEKTVHNKKKGLGEFLHCQRSFAPNYNPRFHRLIEENNKRFTKYKGIFTELYESANKNGNIYAPFQSEDVKITNKSSKKQ